MTTKTNPEAIAREIMRLDKAATPGPWCGLADEEDGSEDTRFLQSLANPGESLLGLDVDGYAIVMSRSDGALIATYRNTAPVLAAAYLDLRAQLDAVTAQRDELREAAADFVRRVANVVPEDAFGARRLSLKRLRAALEGA